MSPPLRMRIITILGVSEMSSSDSDSDHDNPPADINLAITQSDAHKNYQEAGRLVPEEADQISLEKYGHLINPSNDHVLQEVLTDLALPYKLADFQTISIHTLLQKRDLVLVSPTGTGKMNVISLGIIGLRQVFGNMKGVAIVTQPLSAIMNEKLKNKDVKTAVLTMTGKLKNDEGQDDAELDQLEADVLEGVYPVVIGHPESWSSRKGQQLLMEMRKRDMILLIGTELYSYN
jgi:superfamily II DNA helicase RecQ